MTITTPFANYTANPLKAKPTKSYYQPRSHDRNNNSQKGLLGPKPMRPKNPDPYSNDKGWIQRDDKPKYKVQMPPLNEKQKENLESLIIDLRAILQSAGKVGLTAGEICRDYEDVTFGGKIDPTEFGYSPDDENALFSLFFNGCRPAMKYDKDEKKFLARCNEDTYKLQKLINRTKIRKRKRNTGKNGKVRASRME